jgi:hypothetical protein
VDPVIGGRGANNLEGDDARFGGDGSRSVVRRLFRLKRVPVVNCGGIVRDDTDSMLGQAGVKLLGGTVELSQVEDLGRLIRGVCP